MFSREENEMLTRVEQGAPMGELFRRYWIPALLSEEISEPDCPPVKVRLLGEDLVAFRDTQGRVGLFDERCSHRGTSLFYGRNEECGLRCIYHGWKYDVEGNVVETPAEAPGSNLKNKIRHTAYPCFESAGIVFTYMGAKEKAPIFPAYRWAGLREENLLVVKAHQECNFLQGLEGDCDSSHVSYLHNDSVGQKSDPFRSIGNPTLEHEETDYGVRMVATRAVSAEKSYIRITNFVMPAFSLIPTPGSQLNETAYQSFRFWIPIDDYNTWNYILSIRHAPFTAEERARARSRVDANYMKVRNRRNHYLQDRGLQRTTSMTGIIGVSVAEQDACATESMGSVCDRTREHLGYGDKTVIAIRRYLLDALRMVAEGRDPPHVIRDPDRRAAPDLISAGGVVPAGAGWRGLL
ncbi:MAG TPA: Rieske 2Fe-2S domain-containing protein [Candidatus Binatia bacterium]|jgi:nitrite reductase/ring-hydroxylating ferredoxin subunit